MAEVLEGDKIAAQESIYIGTMLAGASLYNCLLDLPMARQLEDMNDNNKDIQAT